MQVFVPVSLCKDTYYFDKTNNYFKKVKEKGDQVSGLLCPKLTELLYYLHLVISGISANTLYASAIAPEPSG